MYDFTAASSHYDHLLLCLQLANIDEIILDQIRDVESITDLHNMTSKFQLNITFPHNRQLGIISKFYSIFEELIKSENRYLLPHI